MKAPDVLEVADLEESAIETEEVNTSLRAKIEMDDDDREEIQFVMDQVNQLISQMFAQTFANERKLLEKVRVTDQNGDWLRNPDGSFVEDWNSLTDKDLEEYLLAASSDVFFGSQRVIDTLGEASFAKLIYDDAYDNAYHEQIKGTINDKQAKARRATIDKRYVAIYKSLVNQRAKQVIDRADQHIRRIETIYRERSRNFERSIRATKESF